MTFNGSWGWRPTPPDDWHSARKVIRMLHQVTAGGGNLLLNIGPLPDGSVPPEAAERLTKVGKWVAKYGEAVYGKVDRIENLELWSGAGTWTRKGRTGYFWAVNWPGEQLSIGGLRTKVKSVALLPGDKPLRFQQTSDRLIVKGLPKRCPDRLCDIGMLKVQFAGKPKQRLGAGVVCLNM